MEKNESSSGDAADQSPVNLSGAISASVVSITAALGSASITTEAPSNPFSVNPSGTIFAAPAAPPCSFVPPLPSTQASVAVQDKEQDVWTFCRIETERSKTRDLPPDYTPPQCVPPPSFSSIFQPIAPGSPLAPQSDKGTSGSVIPASHTYPAFGAPPSVPTPAYSVAGPSSSFMPPAPRRDNQVGSSKLSDVCIKLQKQHWRKVKGMIRNAKVPYDHWEDAKASVLRESKARLQDPTPEPFLEFDKDHGIPQDGPVYDGFFDDEDVQKFLQDLDIPLEGQAPDEFVANEPPSSNEERQKQPDSNEK